MMTHAARIIGLVIFGWMFLALLFIDPLQFPAGAPAPLLFIGPAFLGVHEAGHVLTGTLTSHRLTIVLAGSLAQWSAPLFFCVFFLWRKQTFSAAVLLGLTAFSLMRSVPYINDANARILPLFPSNDVGHDWNEILFAFGLLSYERTVALCVSYTGKLLIIMSVLGMAWSTLWPLLKRPVYVSQGIIEGDRLDA